MNTEKLKKEYKYKTELHAHSSNISPCSEVSAEELVCAYTAAGADAIVLTNHFIPRFFSEENAEKFLKKYYDEYLYMKKIGKEKNVNILFGAEIRFCENANDYLIYGLEENDLKIMHDYLEKGIDAFYKNFKTDKNLILQAHPFRDGMTLMNPKSIDGVEVFNMHPNHNSRISLAGKYAKENNFIISGGTDYHHLGHEGLCYLRTKFKPETSYEIAEVLKSGDYVFDIEGNIVLPYFK